MSASVMKINQIENVAFYLTGVFIGSIKEDPWLVTKNDWKHLVLDW